MSLRELDDISTYGMLAAREHRYRAPCSQSVADGRPCVAVVLPKDTGPRVGRSRSSALRIKVARGQGGYRALHAMYLWPHGVRHA